MQVANALNNTIRILFNPKVEAFKLFDILLVQSENDRYLAQIMEIYDDKFDASQNVAKLKLFYKVSENNEVIPYDNFTPNKECDIVKINQQDVEKFINEDKKTFNFGLNFTTDVSFNIQEEFFENNPLIFSDKTENVSDISITISKNLSNLKNTVIVDYTGMLDFDDAKKIKATKDFQLPLNSYMLDFVFDKFLSDASLEFQATGNEILKALKKFIDSTKDGFLPFNAFTKVIKEQYKATPHPELKIFISRLERCQLKNIFAKNKNEYKNFTKAISQNKITIVDLSSLDICFQRLYFEYLIDEIKDDIFLLTRINDENCDVNLINKIYNKKTNINFIPNLSYSYKKLPSITQYCKNYIMLPSLSQRNDFLEINISYSNIINEGCLVFGENTNNFIYFVKDYILKPEEKRRTYKTISLSFIENAKLQEKNKDSIDKNAFQKAKENYNPTPDSKRLMKELSTPENVQVAEINVDVEQSSEVEEEPDSYHEEISVEHGNQAEVSQEKNSLEENKISGEKFDIKLEELLPEEETVFNETFPNEQESLQIEETEQNQEENIQEVQVQEELQIQNDDSQLDIQEEFEAEPEQSEEKELLTDEKTPLAQMTPFSDEKVEIVDFSEEELDFFKLAKESASENNIDENKEQNQENKQDNQPETVLVDDIEYKTQNDIQDNKKKEEFEKLSKEENDDVDLSEMANNSIDESFEQIVNEKVKNNGEVFDLGDDIKIANDAIQISNQDDSLPIFNEKEPQDSQNIQEYTTGASIVHKKYGKGTIIKIVKYENRQLLQIEFEESGKKLLDPAVADIKIEQ